MPKNVVYIYYKRENKNYSGDREINYGQAKNLFL